MHIGIDSAEKIVHSVVTTAANVHDSQVLPQLLHGKETRVWGDSAYRGQRAAPRREILRMSVPIAGNRFRVPSGESIVASHRSVRELSMCSAWSRASSVFVKSATVVLPKTQTSSTYFARSQICSFKNEDYCALQGRSVEIFPKLAAFQREKSAKCRSMGPISAITLDLCHDR